MKAVIVIPARANSTRMPNKPMLRMRGQTLAWHAWHAAASSTLTDDVIVATDCEEIAASLPSIATVHVDASTEFANGTQRVAAALDALQSSADAVINLQVDEPTIPGRTLDRLIEAVATQADRAVTLLAPLQTGDQGDRNTVKATSRRTPIQEEPKLWEVTGFTRERSPFAEWVHVGVYGFQRDCLRQLAALPPTVSAQRESLEQLTWQAQSRLVAIRTRTRPISINTTEDVTRWERWLNLMDRRDSRAD